MSGPTLAYCDLCGRPLVSTPHRNNASCQAQQAINTRNHQMRVEGLLEELLQMKRTGM